MVKWSISKKIKFIEVYSMTPVTRLKNPEHVDLVVVGRDMAHKMEGPRWVKSVSRIKNVPGAGKP